MISHQQVYKLIDTFTIICLILRMGKFNKRSLWWGTGDGIPRRTMQAKYYKFFLYEFNLFSITNVLWKPDNGSRFTRSVEKRTKNIQSNDRDRITRCCCFIRLAIGPRKPAYVYKAKQLEKLKICRQRPHYRISMWIE